MTKVDELHMDLSCSFSRHIDLLLLRELNESVSSSEKVRTAQHNSVNVYLWT